MLHVIVPLLAGLSVGPDGAENRRQMQSTSAPPPPTPGPPVYVPDPDGSATFVVTSGFQYCHVEWMIVNGQNLSCVTDGIGQHGNYESCTFRTQGPLYATAIYYDIESGYDYLEISGVQYTNTAAPPRNLDLDQGSILSWFSDASVVAGGFEICATSSQMVFYPPSPLPPPPPSASPYPPGLAPPPFYHHNEEMDSSCGTYNLVTTTDECVAAAAFIGLGNLTLTIDSSSSSSAPPGCYTMAHGLDCRESCYWTSDNDCDDGGPGSEYTACDLGADCIDCGPRAVRALIVSSARIGRHPCPRTRRPRARREASHRLRPANPVRRTMRVLAAAAAQDNNARSPYFNTGSNTGDCTDEARCVCRNALSPSSPPPMPPPLQPVPAGTLWGVTSGSDHCHPHNGTGLPAPFNTMSCITDGVDPYTNDEDCTITVYADVLVTAAYFNTESSCEQPSHLGHRPLNPHPRPRSHRLLRPSAPAPPPAPLCAQTTTSTSMASTTMEWSAPSACP